MDGVESTDRVPSTDTNTADAASSTPAVVEGGLLEALECNTAKPALRQEQVANAVTFLTNPKVVGSTSGAKRSFLLGKGVTDGEIDAAMEKAKTIVPDPALAAPTGTAQVQPTAEHPSLSSAIVNKDSSPKLQPTPTSDLKASWTRITAAVVLVGFASVGASTVAMPYLKKGWRWFIGADETDDSDVKKVTDALEKHAEHQQLLSKQVKDVAEAVKALQDNKEQSSVDSRASAQLDALRNDVTALSAAVAQASPVAQEVTEIKSMLQRQTPSISRQSSGPFRSPRSFPEPPPSSATDRAAAASRPLFATPAGTPNTSTLPSGAVLGAGSVQGGSSIYTPHSSPPATAFGSSGYPGNSILQTPPPAHMRNGINGHATSAASHMHSEGSITSSQQMASNVTGASGSEPPHPPEFYSVLDMVAKGMTPSGVRTDIVDTPVDPPTAPTPPSMSRKPKPWEHSTTASRTPDLQGALRAAAESGLGGSSIADPSPFQAASHIQPERGIQLRQEASEAASVVMSSNSPLAVAKAATTETAEGGLARKQDCIRAHAIHAFTRPSSEDLSDDGDEGG